MRKQVQVIVTKVLTTEWEVDPQNPNYVVDEDSLFDECIAHGEVWGTNYSVF